MHRNMGGGRHSSEVLVEEGHNLRDGLVASISEHERSRADFDAVEVGNVVVVLGSDFSVCPNRVEQAKRARVGPHRGCERHAKARHVVRV